jgi:hypothetical protein
MHVPTILPEYVLMTETLSSWTDSFTFYRFLAGNPNPRKQEGFFYRLVFSPNRQEYCLQVVLYYRLQKFPYHINDYHPFFVYYDRTQSMIRLVYDSGHHNIAIVPRAQQHVLTVRFPWHGYGYGKTACSLLFKAANFRLTDDILQGWWLQPGKPQFKLRSKFVDPWNMRLLTQPTGRGSFRDEAICPYCGAIVMMDAMDLKGTILSLPVMCPNKHHFSFTYNFCSMSMQSL